MFNKSGTHIFGTCFAAGLKNKWVTLTVFVKKKKKEAVVVGSERNMKRLLISFLKATETTSLVYIWIPLCDFFPLLSVSVCTSASYGSHVFVLHKPQESLN